MAEPSAKQARSSPIKIAETGERLTIDVGVMVETPRAMVATLILFLIVGAIMTSCSYALDNFSGIFGSDPEVVQYYRENPHTPWATIATGVLSLLALLSVPFWSDTRVVFDRARRTLGFIRVRAFGTRVRREVALASVRGAKVTGSLGARWQLVLELDSGEILELPSLYTEAYEPVELRQMAERINRFLGVAAVEGGMR